MGIYNVNTIQNNVDSSYTDAYIKEALANLGQRVGARGDSIISDSFKITDILTAEENNDYIKIDNKTFSADEFYKTSETYINILEPEVNDITNAYIYKKSNYNLVGIELSDDIINRSSNLVNDDIRSLLALEIHGEQGIVNGLQLIYNNQTRVITIYKFGINEYYTCRIGDNTEFSYTDIYDTYFAPAEETYDDVDKIFENIIRNCENVETKKLSVEPFKALNAIVPKYVKEVFNSNIYNSGKDYENSFLGLKRYIIYSLYEYLCNKYKNADTTDNENTGQLIIKKDFDFSYFINTSSNIIYYSYDFNIQTIEEDGMDKIDYIYDIYFVHSNIHIEKYISFKFEVNYYLDDKYINNVSIIENFIYPYIAEKNDDLIWCELGYSNKSQKYWYINDTLTNIPANGANAGNANMIVLSYLKSANEQKEEHTNTGIIKPVILHGYSDVDNNVVFNEDHLHLDNTKYEFNYYLNTFVNSEIVQATITNNIDDTNKFKFSIILPDINRYINENILYKPVFENCIIWTCVDTELGRNNDGEGNTLKEFLQNNNTAGINTFISVFWRAISEDDGNTYKWQLITNPAFDSEDNIENDIALDLGSMLSLTNITKFILDTQYEPDKYKHSYVVFDKVTSTTKNQQITDASTTIGYPVLYLDTNAHNSDVTTSESTNGFDISIKPVFVPESRVELVNNIITNVKLDGVNDNFTGFLSKKSTDSNNNVVVDPTSFSTRAETPLGANGAGNTIFGDSMLVSGTNGIIPKMDFKEVFLSNQTSINRISILGVGGEPGGNIEPNQIYHTFLGKDANTAADELVLGSTATNYNMSGNKTLFVPGNLKSDDDTTESNKNDVNPDIEFGLHKIFRIDLPTEISEILVSKIQNTDNLYYSVISVELPKSDEDVYFKERRITTPGTKYMAETTNCQYIFKYGEFIRNNFNHIYVGYDMIANVIQLKRITDPNEHKLVNFIIYLRKYENKEGGFSKSKKFELVGIEEIISSSNYVSPGTNNVSPGINSTPVIREESYDYTDPFDGYKEDYIMSF